MGTTNTRQSLPEYLTNPSLGDDLVALLAQYALSLERDALAANQDLVQAATIRKYKRWAAQTAEYQGLDNPLTDEHGRPVALRPVDRGEVAS